MLGQRRRRGPSIKTTLVRLFPCGFPWHHVLFWQGGILASLRWSSCRDVPQTPRPHDPCPRQTYPRTSRPGINTYKIKTGSCSDDVWIICQVSLSTRPDRRNVRYAQHRQRPHDTFWSRRTHDATATLNWRWFNYDASGGICRFIAEPA